MQAADEQVLVAIVVVVGHSDTEVKSLPSQPRRIRDIGEPRTAVVLEQPIAEAVIGLAVTWQFGTVGKKQVQVAIVSGA